MPTFTTNPIKITDPGFPTATATFSDLAFLGTQTVSSTKRAQLIPFTLLGLATTTNVLQKASNLSDLADVIAARGNLGAKNLWYVTGTAAPGNTIGIVNDFAFNDNGVLYEKTAATTWTSRIDFVTQAELTAANYLTATAANLLYAPIGENAGPGLRYTYNTSTTFPATTGQILLSAATFAATTSISVHTSDRNSRDFASILDLGVSGSRLQLTFDGAEETYAWFNITAIATSGSTRTYTVTHIQSNGTPENGEMLLQVVTVGGGGSGGGIRLERTFSTTTTGNPTSGTLRLASTNPQTTPATVKINDTRNVNSFLTDQGNLLDKINIGNIIQITNIASGVYHVYQVTGISTAIVATTTTSYNFTCDWLFGTAGVSSFPNNAEVAFTWLPDNSTTSSLTVRTVDSSVTGSASELVLPNGTLAIASGVATYTPAVSAPQGGGITWASLTANITAVKNMGYKNDGGTLFSITLPAAPALGDVVAWANTGTGGIKIFANNGQNLRGLSQLITGAGKYLQSTNQFAYGAAIALSATEWILQYLPINMAFGEDIASLVKSLIHFNEAANSTSFSDLVVPSRVITVSGNAKAAAGAKFGNGVAINTPTSGTDYIQFPVSSPLGTSDFCLEFWITTTGSYFATSRWISAFRGTPTIPQESIGANGILFTLLNDVGNSGNQDNSNPRWQSIVTLATSTYASWIGASGTYHIAMTRQGNTFRVFTNGVSSASGTTASTVDFGTDPFIVRFSGSPYNDTEHARAIYDEFRLTIGDAVYTTAFTPPSAEFTYP